MMFPRPPEGAKERTVELGKMRMRTLRLSKMPLGRLIALQLGNFFADILAISAF